jgi:hypothetical protein
MKYKTIHKIVITVLSVLFFSSSCKKEKGAMQNDSNNQIDSIQFSGYKWFVKNSVSTIGPGPNYWNSKNVWVDDTGRLHLKLRKEGDKWTCAEIYSEDLFDFGTYQFWIEGTIDQLDKNVVLGLFTYSGKDGFDEIDIEFARWGISLAPNVNYNVWPAQGSIKKTWSATKYLSLTTQSTQRFIRTPDSVSFQTLSGFRDDNNEELFAITCTDNELVSKIPMHVHLNLWLFKGKEPTDKKEIEVIVHSFKYK